MFPFNLPGPVFLVVFVGLLIALSLTGYFWGRRAENGPIPKLPRLDPLLLAHLRGGEAEVIRTVVVSLLDRGLLTADGVQVETAAGVTPDLARRPIEQAVLKRCGSAVDARELLTDAAVLPACKPLGQELAAAGLLPDTMRRVMRWSRAAALVAVYLAVAVVKAGVGLMRDAPIVILVGLALFGSILIVAACVSPRRTPVGDAFLAGIRTFLLPLKARAASLRPGGADADVTLLVGAFGVAVLPESTFGEARALFPKAAAGETIASSCGASCGSSGCGGGGSGCGGGGGCGGCGGD